MKEGQINLDTQGNKDHSDIWILYDKEFTDFDLSLKVKTLRETKGNSGVQIRSRYLPHATKGMWMHGPQIDVHPPTPFRTGLIYNATFESRRWIHPDKKNWAIAQKDAKHTVLWNKGDWNTLRIKAVGMKIQTWLNGQAVSDFDSSGILDDKIHQGHKVG